MSQYYVKLKLNHYNIIYKHYTTGDITQWNTLTITIAYMGVSVNYYIIIEALF